MQFGVVVPTHGGWSNPRAVIDATQAAEDLGFDTVWFGDHIVIPGYAKHMSPPRWLEPLSCAFFLAGVTTRIRFGTDVLVLPYRNPVWLSQLVASADQLCGGRLTLGVGVGYISGEFEAMGAPPYADRGAVTDEYIAAMRTLWETEGGASFSGAWVDFDDIHAEPKPLQDPFPVWVGGNAPIAARRAAALGDGWHPLFPTPERYAQGRAVIERERAAAGRSGDFVFSYSCAPSQVILSESERQIPVGRDPELEVPAEYGYAPMPPMDGQRMRMTGTPDELIDDVATLQEAGVDHLALRFSIFDETGNVDEFVEQLERFTTSVAPAFESKKPR